MALSSLFTPCRCGRRAGTIPLSGFVILQKRDPTRLGARHNWRCWVEIKAKSEIRRSLGKFSKFLIKYYDVMKVSGLTQGVIGMILCVKISFNMFVPKGQLIIGT